MDKLDMLDSTNTITSCTNFCLFKKDPYYGMDYGQAIWCSAITYPTAPSSNRYCSTIVVDIQMNKTSLNVYTADLFPDHPHFQTEIYIGKTQ